MPTHYDDNTRVMEQRIQLLQGSALGHNNGKTQIGSYIVFWDKQDEVQNQGHKCGNPTYDSGSNSFPGVHLHHNVGSQEGGACLDD